VGNSVAGYLIINNISVCYRPEPWDLTQLNIEASVISLNSKIMTLVGQGANITFSSFRPNNPIQRAHSVKAHPSVPSPKLGVGPSSLRKSLREESSTSASTEEKREGGKPSLHIPISSSEVTVGGKSVDRKEDWSEELRGSLKKLRFAMDGLLKTSRLAHSIFRLQENPEKSHLGFIVKYRRDVCFSQAVSVKRIY